MNTYTVVGDKSVLGHEPGETFQADIPIAQEERLIARGAIEPGPGNTPLADPDESVDRSPRDGDEEPFSAELAERENNDAGDDAGERNEL